MKKFGFLAALIFSTFIPSISWGQQYPSKPIKIVVGFAAGGAPDIIARIIGKKLSDSVGQPVVIENRAGASGNIAAQAVVASEPDGHTLLMATVSVAISPSYQPNLAFSPARDFTPVGMVASVPLILIVKPELGVNNLQELIALAKAKPGQLNYASVGPGSPQHLSGELFQYLGSVKMAHIPYKGGGPATQSVLAGETDLFFAGMPPAMPFVRSGKVKALAVTSAKRSSAAPEVPTVQQAGMQGFEADNWHALYAARGTPTPIVDKLNLELQRILSAPDVKEQLLNQGAEAWLSTPLETRNYLVAEIDKWSKVVKAAGLKAE
jgi:tripartite-type tricarboxylate transporter receptor subunit TctC